MRGMHCTDRACLACTHLTPLVPSLPPPGALRGHDLQTLLSATNRLQLALESSPEDVQEALSSAPWAALGLGDAFARLGPTEGAVVSSPLSSKRSRVCSAFVDEFLSCDVCLELVADPHVVCASGITFCRMVGARCCCWYLRRSPSPRFHSPSPTHPLAVHRVRLLLRQQALPQEPKVDGV